MAPSTHKDNSPSENTARNHCCKVSKVTEKYSLTGLDKEIQSQRNDGASLRDLAVYINDRIITSIDLDISASPSTIRRVITSDSVAETDLDVATYERIITRLDNSAVDVPSVDRDLVSHETVRIHLKDHLDVETSRERSSTSIEETRDMIASIRERDASIIERALEALRREDLISSGSIDGSLSARVTCSACGRSYAVDEFLDNEGCKCRGAGDVPESL